MEKPSAAPGDRDGNNEQEQLSDELTRIRSAEARTKAELSALEELARRELLGPRVDLAVKAVAVAKQHGAHGIPVDVLMTSSRDPIGEQVFATAYDKLGLAGARAEADRETWRGDDGEVLGDEYHIVSGPEFAITERQHEDPMSGDRYRTLSVMRSVHESA